MSQIMVTNGNIVTDNTKNTNREKFLSRGTKTNKPIRKIGWQEWDEATSALAHELMLKHIDPDIIYAIPRGGLLLGVQMSHVFRAPLVVKHPRTWGYDSTGLTNPNRFTGDGHRLVRVLVLDEIVDTGKAMRKIRAKEWLRPYDVHYAAVYCDPKQSSTVDTYQVPKHTKQWLEFPWETTAKDVHYLHQI